MSDQAGLFLDGVVKRYSSKTEIVHAVEGVSLAVRPGEVVALVGPSGSGKTTLLLLAAGLLAPDTGTVTFDRQDLQALSETESGLLLRRNVGIVHQTFQLFPGASAIDNAAMKLLADNVRLTEARHRARPWLERLGLGRRLDHRPHELSGGERQRVAIARAMANGPRLILADEPTASLDSRRSVEVLDLLAAHCHEHGVGMLLVTHDREGATVADTVLTLRDGRLTTPESRSPSTHSDPIRSA